MRARARGERGGGRVQCAFWQELDRVCVCLSVCLSVLSACLCQRVFKRLHMRKSDMDSTVSVCLVAVLNVLKHTGTV